MSIKQRNKLIGIIVGLVVVVGIVFGAIFFLDTDSMSSSGDIEAIKANGGYELFKADLIEATRMRDSQAVTIANTFFETIGIKNYEGMDTNARRGNFAIYADSYKFDSFIIAGELSNCYIGNVVIYSNPEKATTTVANAITYSYEQYNILVNSFTKALKVEPDVGKNLYEELTMMNISSFNNIKSGKLNGIKGFYGTEGEMKYFMTIENGAIRTIHVVCDAYDPIEIYNSITPSEKVVGDVKVLMGARQGIANLLSFRMQQETGLTVTFPAALLNGDDSWLMVRNGDEVYIEVRGEVQESAEKKVVKDFIIRMDFETRALHYLKIDKKVYIDE